ncbi:MAG: 2OG-Fe(II) oxygenase [Acidobacteriota bacterium]
MKMDEIVPDKIFTILDVLTEQECDEYIRISEHNGYVDAPITTAAGFIMRKDVRNNTRVMIDDSSIVNYIWQKIAQYIPAQREGWQAIGLNERIRYYRYEPDQYFAWHYDGCFRRNENEESKLTLMIYLNDNFEGGETKFNLKYLYDEIDVKPKKGMALLFDHYLYHEGSPVISGVKYVLRSDVMYKRILQMVR